MRTEVCAQLRVVGFHHWADAPAQVAYLRYPHRHVFEIRAWTPVSHDNRNVEFHMLARELHDTLRTQIGTNEHGELLCKERSCEHIASLLMQLHPQLSRVEVFEDGEMGAAVFR